MPLPVFLLAVCSVSLNALAQIFLRKMTLTMGPLTPSIQGIFHFLLSLALNPWFIGGMSSYAVSIGLWIMVLSKSEVSLAYPLLSMGYVITAVVGFYFLGENVNLSRLIGIALICVGVIFVSRSA